MDLPGAHQHCPQRERKRERPEGHGISAKSVAIEMERAIEERRRQANFQPQISRHGICFLAEYAAGKVRPQAYIRQQNPGQRQRNVVPFQLERVLHEPGRDEDAQHHHYEQQGAQEKQ